MQQTADYYASLLETQGSAQPGRVAIACREDGIETTGPHDLADLAAQILERLTVTAVIVAVPAQPYPSLLLRRAQPGSGCIAPRDSESRSVLHDIPLIATPHASGLPAAIVSALARRKGCIIDTGCLVSQGALTVEQAYINWSSLYHAASIKYLDDLLQYGHLLPEEVVVADQIRKRCMALSDISPPAFRTGPFCDKAQIVAELAAVGQATVRMGLVDSFFGNISYAGHDACYISQTSARLDQLERQIDAIPFDNSSTAGITASSELPAHQAILAATGCRAILHGHPLFSVVMSFFSSPTQHPELDQICGIPVVGGEGGQGGMAQTLPRAFTLTGARSVIVRGHGVFSIGGDDFNEAFSGLMAVERRCREEYCRRLDVGHPPKYKKGRGYVPHPFCK